jgi:MFS family permease
MNASTRPQTTTGELSKRHRFLVLAICCASVIVVVMDISIVNVALPTIRRDLHASESGLQWTVDAYTLVLAGFLLLAGSTADRLGRRRIFQVGLAVFGLGSLLCGLAPSIGWLIAARALWHDAEPGGASDHRHHVPRPG